MWITRSVLGLGAAAHQRPPRAERTVTSRLCRDCHGQLGALAGCHFTSHVACGRSSKDDAGYRRLAARGRLSPRSVLRRPPQPSYLHEHSGFSRASPRHFGRQGAADGQPTLTRTRFCPSTRRRVVPGSPAVAFRRTDLWPRGLTGVIALVVRRLRRLTGTSRRPPIGWLQRVPGGPRPRATSGLRAPRRPCQSAISSGVCPGRGEGGGGEEEGRGRGGSEREGGMVGEGGGEGDILREHGQALDSVSGGVPDDLRSAKLLTSTLLNCAHSVEANVE